MRFRVLALAVLLSSIGARSGDAQVLRRRDRIQAPLKTPARQKLEERLRTGMARVQNRVGLSDEQMSQLARANRQFDARRKELNQAERAQRVELRAQLLAGQGANQDRIATALDQMLKLQRDRIDLQIEEQRELSAFMSPMQRARYAALQEQIRRRLQGVRANGTRQAPDSE